MLSDEASEESVTDDESAADESATDEGSATDESETDDTSLSVDVGSLLLPPSQAVREADSASTAIIAKSLFFITCPFKIYFEKNLWVQVKVSPFESSL